MSRPINVPRPDKFRYIACQDPSTFIKRCALTRQNAAVILESKSAVQSLLYASRISSVDVTSPALKTAMGINKAAHSTDVFDGVN